MLVHQILKSKASDAVVTVKPGTPISDVAAILSEKRIGTVVVSPDGETASGILSERDIVRELARCGAACLTAPVEEYMTTKLQSCKLADTADSVLSRMTEGRFRHMPVVEEGILVGLITIGDVVKSRLSELSMEKDALQDMIMGH